LKRSGRQLIEDDAHSISLAAGLRLMFRYAGLALYIAAAKIVGKKPPTSLPIIAVLLVDPATVDVR
jgi:hypothetical protein